MAVLISGRCCWRAAAARWCAAFALALVLLALANPSLTREDRDPSPSVAAVIVDKSPSQEFGDRAQQTESRARDAGRAAQAHSDGLEVRVVEARTRPTARPTARSCSRALPRHSPMCRPTASPAPS